MNSPSPQQLRALLAVAEHLHFGNAADALEMSQPALSAQIAALEKLVGVKLVERTTRRVLMTPAGEQVARRASVVMAELDNLMSSVNRNGEPLTGRVHLGVIPTIAPYLLPPLLARMRKDHPELTLLLHEDQTGSLLTSLRAGRIDLALLALPTEAPDIEEVEVAEEPFSLVVPRHHPFAARSSVGPAEIGGSEVLLLEDGHCLRSQALAVCNRAGAAEVQSIRANSISTLVQMVASGVGITLLPEMALKPELAGVDDASAVRFDGPVPHRTIGVAMRKSSDLQSDALALRDVCRQLMPVAAALN